MSSFGVDGCRTGWFFFELRKDGYTFGVVASLANLVGRMPEGGRIFVDIPIGLRDTDGTPRACDAAARRLLGPRRSSVFPAPIRAVLKAATYEEANTQAKRLAGRGISRQTFAILPKIAEVDGLLLSNAQARRSVREVHPEVCFWGLAGGRPMQSSKKSQKGFEERLGLLSDAWGPAEDAIAKGYLWCGGLGVSRDDVVDALVLAVTAARPARHLSTLPSEAEWDGRGLPMEMVYAKKRDRHIYRRRIGTGGVHGIVSRFVAVSRSGPGGGKTWQSKRSRCGAAD